MNYEVMDFFQIMIVTLISDDANKGKGPEAYTARTCSVLPETKTYCPTNPEGKKGEKNLDNNKTLT